MGGFIADKLSTLVDPERAAKLADRVQDLISKSALHKATQSKRNLENGEAEARKKLKEECDGDSVTSQANNLLSPNQVEYILSFG